MGRTLNEIVYFLKSSYKKVNTDDESPDDRVLATWVRNRRSIWLKRNLAKSRYISPSFIQNLGLITLDPVDETQALLPIDFKVFKATQKIPDMIEIDGAPTIVRIGPSILTRGSYLIIPYERAQFIGLGRFDTNSIFAFITDKELYVATKGNSLSFMTMRKINMKCVLSNPVEAASFINADGTPCYTDESDYPITEDLLALMKDMIINIDFRMLGMEAVVDDKNNARDDSTLIQMRQTKSRENEQPDSDV